MSSLSTDQVITIKEAAEKYKKAEITVRRLIRSIVQDESSANRSFIHPSPEEVQKLKKKQKPFTYSVNSILLDKIYGEVEKVKQAKAAKQNTSGDTTVNQSDFFDLIKQQLQVKDEQIRALNQSLDEMTVRSRESNVLMKGLHEKILQLPERKNVVDVAPEKREPGGFGSINFV